jgi:hypothetical protein
MRRPVPLPDPRREAILIRRKGRPEFVDKTSEILRYHVEPSRVWVTYHGGKTFRHSAENVAVLRNPVRVQVGDNECVEVNGQVWPSVVEVWRFDGHGVPWWRVFYATNSGAAYGTYRQVRILRDQARVGAAGVLDYWRTIVSRLPSDDPLRHSYGDLRFVHPESVLGRYLDGEAMRSAENVQTLIFPFSSNRSQREAVHKALSHSLCVVDGPPGTGKTQTILNLIANIITAPGKTVGVVSYSNAAVENVYDKLTELGFGFVMASLGRKEKKEDFFQRQAPIWSAEATALARSEPVGAPSTERIADLARSLHRWQEDERQLAQWREELDAYRLERRHFSQYFERQELPELQRLPLLKRSAQTILDFLAEAELSRGERAVGRLIRRVKGYLKYGPTRGLDAGDTDIVLRLQLTYYDKRIDELQRRIDETAAALERTDLDRLSEQHRLLSIQALRAALQQRYAATARADYALETYRHRFDRFTYDYPVILSTCHSLRQSLPAGYLLDYLIIDEASQVDLLAAGLVLASCRNVVIVGDLQQLRHIAHEAASHGAAPPSPAYDYVKHNILSSVTELYGDALPRTLLREHYRCDPAIIGFCNTKFYRGQLIPYTRSVPGAQPLVLVRTTQGNHMRQHRGGGRSNQREIDVIREEVIPTYCGDTADAEIGVTTPYRHQADKIADVLIENIEADTVHKFQGREKDVVIMTTVLDETWRGRTGTSFVDDPRLVNVAVSRAVKRFVLVTNHDMLPKSQNLSDLIGYIRYRDPDHDVVDSEVVSVFDLLYRDYSARLRPLASRLRQQMRYRSEDILWTVLHDIFAEPRYTQLDAVHDVLLRNLLAGIGGLTAEQAAFVQRRASVDFVVFNRITRGPVLAIEVDGFKYHEDNPAQLVRDALKDQICAAHRIPLLRLPTTGSGEERLIRQKLDQLMNSSMPSVPDP